MPTVPTRQRWLTPVLVVVAALTVSGGLLAQEFYDGDSGTGHAAGGVHRAPTSSTPAAQHTDGSAMVDVTTAVAENPAGDEIRALLRDYFDAINSSDYQQWASTVTSDWVRTKSASQWLAGYRSTHVNDVRAYRIEPIAGQRLRVLVGFTSTQDPEDAPVDLPVDCIRWHQALPVVRVNGEWQLTEPANTVPERSECSASQTRPTS